MDKDNQNTNKFKNVMSSEEFEETFGGIDGEGLEEGDSSVEEEI